MRQICLWAMKSRFAKWSFGVGSVSEHGSSSQWSHMATCCSTGSFQCHSGQTVATVASSQPCRLSSETRHECNRLASIPLVSSIYTHQTHWALFALVNSLNGLCTERAGKLMPPKAIIKVTALLVNYNHVQTVPQWPSPCLFSLQPKHHKLHTGPS